MNNTQDQVSEELRQRFWNKHGQWLRENMDYLTYYKLLDIVEEELSLAVQQERDMTFVNKRRRRDMKAKKIAYSITINWVPGSPFQHSCIRNSVEVVLKAIESFYKLQNKKTWIWLTHRQREIV